MHKAAVNDSPIDAPDGVYSTIIAGTHGWCEAISRGIILPRVHEVRSIGPRMNWSELGTMKPLTPQEVHI